MKESSIPENTLFAREESGAIGLDCPWHAEFKQEWEAGKLARAFPM